MSRPKYPARALLLLALIRPWAVLASDVSEPFCRSCGLPDPLASDSRVLEPFSREGASCFTPDPSRYGKSDIRNIRNILIGAKGSIPPPVEGAQGGRVRHLDVCRSGERSNLVPALGMLPAVPKQGTLVKLEAPVRSTTTRVLFDRFEKLTSNFVSEKEISLLGKAVPLELRPGSNFELTNWNLNDLKKSVCQGFQFLRQDGVPLTAAELRSILSPAHNSPAQCLTSTDEGAPEYRPCSSDGELLQLGASGIVLTPPVPPSQIRGWTLRYRATARQRIWVRSVATAHCGRKAEHLPLRQVQETLGPEGVNLKGDQTYHFHQQGVFPGQYTGKIGMGRGDWALIAAPGSGAYGGEDFSSTDLCHKRAAFLTPIEVDLQPPAHRPAQKYFSIHGGVHPSANPNQVDVVYFNPQNPSERVELSNREQTEYRKGWKLKVTFKGGASTALGVHFSDQDERMNWKDFSKTYPSASRGTRPCSGD